MQDKTSKINSIFDFFAHLEYHYRFPIQDIKRLLFEYDEKLKFAALLRLELQKNDSTKSNFLYHVFYMMQRDPTKEVEAFSEDSSTEAFFSKISCVDDIIPVIVCLFHQRETRHSLIL